jgi:hypothetical protein
LTNYSSCNLSTTALDNIWGATTRSLTDRSSFALSTTERDNIWTHSTRILTSYSSCNLSTTALDNIWGATTRSLTDKSSFALSTTAIDNLYTAYIESTETVKQTLQILRAEAAGASTGGGTSTAVFYSPNSSAARITATVSSDGNRNTPTFNLS